MFCELTEGIDSQSFGRVQLLVYPFILFFGLLTRDNTPLPFLEFQKTKWLSPCPSPPCQPLLSYKGNSVFLMDCQMISKER